MTTIVGIDLSLTCTGVAIIRDGQAITGRITSKGKADATLDQRVIRLHNLALEIGLRAADAKPDLVLIEAPAYSKSMGSMHDRSGLWWLTVDLIDSLDRPIVEVTSGGRAKYATGKGNASKDDVLSAVVRRYSTVDVNGNDEADALILAAMGARHLGSPIEESLPKVNLEAMSGVAWPEIEPAS
jgi:crossover junction endodeoxyribonuclease RuvC